MKGDSPMTGWIAAHPQDWKILQDEDLEEFEDLDASEEEVCAAGGHELVIGQDVRSCWCGQRVQEPATDLGETLLASKPVTTLPAAVTTPGVDMRARVRWEAKWLLIAASVLAGCILILVLVGTSSPAVAVGVGTLGVISFCFTILSAVDTITAWRARHEIVDSSDIDPLIVAERKSAEVQRAKLR